MNSNETDECLSIPPMIQWVFNMFKLQTGGKDDETRAPCSDGAGARPPGPEASLQWCEATSHD